MARGVGRANGGKPLKKTATKTSQDISRSSLAANSAIAPPRAVAARWLVWSFTFILVTMVSATLGATLALFAPWQGVNTQQERSLSDWFRDGLQYGISSPTNVLVMGIDQVPEVTEDSDQIFRGRSDTMLLLRLDPDDHGINVLSIPRDTQVEIPGAGLTKINHANLQGGPALASKVVTQNLNGVPVDRYVRVSTGAFRELVDLVGGVEVFVPQRMKYEDQTQHLKIDLEPGWQTLNGDQAEQFARFRSDRYGDIGRAQRQQALVKALRKRLTNPFVLAQLPKIFSVIPKYIDTNLSVGEMVSMVQLTLQLKPDQLKMVLLPGRFSRPGEYASSYWIMDSEATERVMRDYFHNGTESWSLEETPALQNLKIAIQNASGEPQASQWMASYLEEQGIRRVYIDNDWPETQHQTQVIVQRGDLEAAKALQAALGNVQVEADSTGNLDSDLTIRLGEDWAEAQANNSQP